MGITFTVTTIEDTPVASAFTQLSGYRSVGASAAGRFALNFSEGAEIHDNKRSKPAGKNGNYIVRNGRTAKLITLKFSYIGEYAAVRTLEKADLAKWCNLPLDITDDIGDVLTRYNLIEDGYRRVTDQPIPFSFGANTFIRIDAQATFTKDG